MKEHTTHFDDCGCKSAELNAEIDRLKSEIYTLHDIILYLTKGAVTGYAGIKEDKE